VTHLHSISDLKSFGVNPLTGEACAYSMRILCDLSADGAKLVSNFLGLTDIDAFPANWNSTVGGKEASHSVMLARSTLKELMYFALFSEANCDVVVETPDGSLVGLVRSDEYYEKYLTIAAESPTRYTVQRNNATPSAVSGRNTHQLTGRTL